MVEPVAYHFQSSRARAPVTGENPVNGLLRHQLASDHYVFDMRNVADINQWICIEQNQVGPFPHFNAPCVFT